MQRKKWTCFLAGATIAIVSWMGVMPSALLGQSVDDLNFMTEEFAPVNFMKDGQLQGIASDLIVLMLEKMGSKQIRKDIEMLPWVRGYRAVLSKQNTCLFSMTRTEDREELFKWVGPIVPAIIALTAKKDKNIQIASAKDLRKYKIGVVRDDVGEQLLVKAGVPENNLQQVTELRSNIMKLNTGRIDILSYDESVTKWSIKANGFNPDDYETVYVLQKGAVYYALYKETPEALIQQLQSALDALKKEGNYQQILDKYLK